MTNRIALFINAIGLRCSEGMRDFDFHSGECSLAFKPVRTRDGNPQSSPNQDVDQVLNLQARQCGGTDRLSYPCAFCSEGLLSKSLGVEHIPWFFAWQDPNLHRRLNCDLVLILKLEMLGISPYNVIGMEWICLTLGIDQIGHSVALSLCSVYPRHYVTQYLCKHVHVLPVYPFPYRRMSML